MGTIRLGQPLVKPTNAGLKAMRWFPASIQKKALPEIGNNILGYWNESFGHNSDQVWNAQIPRSKHTKAISIFDRNVRLTHVHIQEIVVPQSVYRVVVYSS